MALLGLGVGNAFFSGLGGQHFLCFPEGLYTEQHVTTGIISKIHTNHNLLDF